MAEPAVGEQERLVEKVLELNDELVVANRELVRQREELRSAAHRIRNLEAISAAGLVNLRLDDLLDEVLRIIAEAVGSPRAVLLLLDGDVLVARAAVGLVGVELDVIRVPLGVGVAGTIADDNTPRVIPDLAQVEVHSAYLRESSRSMAGVPLTLDGKVIGVLHVSSGELDRFGEDDLGLLVPAAERAALAIGRAQVLERERRIAETLQRALLPDSLPTIDGLELAALFTPGAGVDVGGDWYDALPLPSGELAVVIGDVAGKGLQAATVMGELRAGLRAYAIEGGAPMETLPRLNRLVAALLPDGDRVAVHVALDLSASPTPAPGTCRRCCSPPTAPRASCARRLDAASGPARGRRRRRRRAGARRPDRALHRRARRAPARADRRQPRAPALGGRGLRGQRRGADRPPARHAQPAAGLAARRHRDHRAAAPRLSQASQRTGSASSP